MGWHEWPLMLFTVLAQCAIGAFWWCFIALWFADPSPERRTRLEHSMIVLWGLMAVGFALSTFHLGAPLRAPNAMLRFWHAPLSNEIVFGGGFFALGLLGWWLAWRDKGSSALRSGVQFLTLLFSIAFLWNMAALYRMPTVPTWDTPLTPSAFLLTALLGGGALAELLFRNADLRSPALVRDGPLGVAAIALFAAVVVAVLQAASLPQTASSIKVASELSPDFIPLTLVRLLLLFGALALWRRQVRVNGQAATLTGAAACVLLVLVAEVIGRGLFYGLYMTVGLL